MRTYIKEARIVKAVQWVGFSVKDARDFTEKHDMPDFHMGIMRDHNGEIQEGLIVYTNTGNRVANVNDYIIYEEEVGYYIFPHKTFDKLHHLKNPDTQDLP